MLRDIFVADDEMEREGGRDTQRAGNNLRPHAKRDGMSTPMTPPGEEIYPPALFFEDEFGVVLYGTNTLEKG